MGRTVYSILAITLISVLAGCGGLCSVETNPDTGVSVEFIAQTSATQVQRVDSKLGPIATITVPSGFEGPRFNPSYTQFVAQTLDGRGFSLFNTNGTLIRNLSTPGTVDLSEGNPNANFTKISNWAFPGHYGVSIDGSPVTFSAIHFDDLSTDGSFGVGSLILRSGIARQNTDGSGLLALTTAEGDESPRISPNQQKVVARRNNLPGTIKSALVVVNIDGTGERQLNTPGVPIVYLWTPDSQSVVYALCNTDLFEWGTSTLSWRIVNVSTGADALYYDKRTVLFSGVVAPSNSPLQ